MMQGQLKCQRCGHGTKETSDAQLFRTAKRRTQMREEVKFVIELVGDFKRYTDVSQGYTDVSKRPSRLRLQKAMTKGRGSWGTTTSSIEGLCLP